MNFSAIIVAGGKGERAGLGINKTLYNLNGRTVLENCVEKFLAVSEIESVTVAIDKDNIQTAENMFASLPVKVVCGGATRTESVLNALSVTTTQAVLIHDGARPYLSAELIKRVISSVKQYGTAIPCTPLKETVALTKDGLIADNIRENAYNIQTPQGFLTQELKSAYALLDKSQNYYDDSTVFRLSGKSPRIVEGEVSNVKLTYPADFRNRYVVGTGFDLHRLTEGRDLILGGVKIPHDKGLLGHSDADVLTHAVMDAILSALSLRDIGYHFPPTDDRYKDISSLILLQKVLSLIDEKGYKVSNISACIMAEKPKLMKYVPEISTNLAKVINISTSQVGITCTTLEQIGIVGREEGIATQAYVALIRK